MRTHALMAVAAGLLIAADASKDDLDELQGTWNLVSAMRDGKEVPEDQVKRTTIIIVGNRFRFPMESRDGTSERGTIKVDASKKPKAMDSTSPKGEVSLGIYEIKGDRYKVCFAPPGKERPTSLDSRPGSGHLLQIWRRTKADEAGKGD